MSLFKFTLAVGLVLLLAAACGRKRDEAARERPGSVPRCIPGSSSECACPSGSKGAQVCRDDGTFGSCECAISSASASTTQVVAPPPPDAAAKPACDPTGTWVVTLTTKGDVKPAKEERIAVRKENGKIVAFLFRDPRKEGMEVVAAGTDETGDCVIILRHEKSGYIGGGHDLTVRTTFSLLVQGGRISGQAFEETQDSFDEGGSGRGRSGQSTFEVSGTRR
jgi:hypothetical protein